MDSFSSLSFTEISCWCSLAFHSLPDFHMNHHENFKTIIHFIMSLASFDLDTTTEISEVSLRFIKKEDVSQVCLTISIFFI